MTENMQRAQLLIQQARWPEAEKEIRGAIAESPDEPLAHAWLAITLIEQEQKKPAAEAAQKAILLEPDWAYSHYVMALVYFRLDDNKKARRAIDEAIRLDPRDERFYGLLSGIHLNERNWKEALAAAEAGLEIDPEDAECVNLRANALVQLGRRDEAGEAIGSALENDPDNAFTHANQGWALLHSGDYKKAMAHFREALRIDPEMDWAREGIVESLKAHNPIYRIMLSYFLYMSRLSSKAQWAIILGLVIGSRLLGQFAESNPDFAPFVYPILGVYLVFVLLSWIAKPLFDLLLRFNRFGRLALSDDQINTTNWIAGCAGLSVLFVVMALTTGNGVFWAGALGSFALILPVSNAFSRDAGRKRNILIGYAGVLSVIGGLGLIMALQGAPAAATLGGIFTLGIVAYTWIANFMTT